MKHGDVLILYIYETFHNINGAIDTAAKKVEHSQMIYYERDGNVDGAYSANNVQQVNDGAAWLWRRGIPGDYWKGFSGLYDGDPLTAAELSDIFPYEIEVRRPPRSSNP